MKPIPLCFMGLKGRFRDQIPGVPFYLVFHSRTLTGTFILRGTHGPVQVVVESTKVGKLVLYPQITLTTLGLLTTSYVHLHALNLGLLSRVCCGIFYAGPEQELCPVCNRFFFACASARASTESVRCFETRPVVAPQSSANL